LLVRTRISEYNFDLQNLDIESLKKIRIMEILGDS
jgi:hypothetical protein